MMVCLPPGRRSFDIDPDFYTMFCSSWDWLVVAVIIASQDRGSLGSELNFYDDPSRQIVRRCHTTNVDPALPTYTRRRNLDRTPNVSRRAESRGALRRPREKAPRDFHAARDRAGGRAEAYGGWRERSVALRNFLTG